MAERRIFFEMLQQGRSSLADARLLARLRHNAELCPMVQRKCEQVIQAVKRNFSIVYDVQGPRDRGVDVLVTLHNERRDVGYIGFQIKSNDEVSSDVYSLLKSQWVDASSNYGERLLDYYILLAWNPEGRTDLIRNVEQSFSGIDRVRVIEPQFVATLLYRLSGSQIAALATSMLAAEDPVIAEVRQTTADWTARQLSIFVEVLARHVEGSAAPTPDDLRMSSIADRIYVSTQPLFWNKGVQLAPGFVAPERAYPEGRGDPWEYLAEDLDKLSGDVEQEVSHYRLSNDMYAVLAVAYDLKARYNPSPAELREMLFELLVPIHGMSPEERADLLAESVWEAGLDGEEAVAVLADLLSVNVPELGSNSDSSSTDMLEIAKWYQRRYEGDEWFGPESRRWDPPP